LKAPREYVLEQLRDYAERMDRLGWEHAEDVLDGTYAVAVAKGKASPGQCHPPETRPTQGTQVPKLGVTRRIDGVMLTIKRTDPKMFAALIQEATGELRKAYLYHEKKYNDGLTLLERFL
jgi:hypothetical protein